MHAALCGGGEEGGAVSNEFAQMVMWDKLQYHIGQLYMIAKHSAEESGDGEGVEVVANRPHEDPVHGKGQYTEKRMYASK